MKLELERELLFTFIRVAVKKEFQKEKNRSDYKKKLCFACLLLLTMIGPVGGGAHKITLTRGDSECCGQKKRKRTFPFEFQPKFPKPLVYWINVEPSVCPASRSTEPERV